jgi:hypothetical protein
MEESNEKDKGFPSGNWAGFWTQPRSVRFHRMALDLKFNNGRISGSGVDEVGNFSIRGSYNLESRKCSWLKKYISHSVSYSGQQQGRCIAGAWDIPGVWSGTFRIWPGGASALEEEFFLKEEASLTLEAPLTEVVLCYHRT